MIYVFNAMRCGALLTLANTDMYTTTHTNTLKSTLCTTVYGNTSHYPNSRLHEVMVNLVS